MPGIKGMRRKIKINTSIIKIRVDERMERDLRLLYSYDKIISGSMSFNKWIVTILNEKLINEVGKLNNLKKLVKGDIV